MEEEKLGQQETKIQKTWAFLGNAAGGGEAKLTWAKSSWCGRRENGEGSEGLSANIKKNSLEVLRKKSGDKLLIRFMKESSEEEFLL